MKKRTYKVADKDSEPSLAELLTLLWTANVVHEPTVDNQLRVLLCEEQSRHFSSNFLSHYKVHSNFFNHQKLCMCEFWVARLYRPVVVSLA